LRKATTANRTFIEDRCADQSGSATENFTTLAHFSVSSAMCLPNSLGVIGIGASFDPIDVPCAVHCHEVHCTLALSPAFMNHLRWHISVGAYIQLHPFIAAFVRHDEGPANDRQRLIRRVPMLWHMKVLRGPDQKFRCFR